MKIIAAFLLAIFSIGAVVAQQAPTEQDLQQLVTKLQTNQDDRDLREKIIKMAAAMSPRPVTPDQARRHMVRGQEAFESAKVQADYQKAVDEYQQAANLAPWLGQAYFNLATAQGKVGSLKAALQNLDLFFLTRPADDALSLGKDLKDRLEYRQEQLDQKAAEQARITAQQQEDARRARDVRNLDGVAFYSEDGIERIRIVGNVPVMESWHKWDLHNFSWGENPSYPAPRLTPIDGHQFRVVASSCHGQSECGTFTIGEDGEKIYGRILLFGQGYAPVEWAERTYVRRL